MANVQVFHDFTISEIGEIDSTNKYAEKLINSGSVPEGSVFYTHNQTSGIGQAGNTWESEPRKNLTASMILYPVFLHPAHQFYLTMVVSLAVLDTVDFFLHDTTASVKWPNDIYCGNRKIAGILIKNQVMGNEISSAIAGLGLNINQTEFTTAPNATSLKLLAGNEYDIIVVLSKWHTHVAKYYDMLKSNRKELYMQYLSKLYLKDVQADYLINGVRVTATITGIGLHGQLVLTDNSGKRYECGLKDVIFPTFR